MDILSQMNANAPHQGLLAGIVAQTTGPVVECGIGHFSTPILHYMCKRRPLLSIEADKEWFDFYTRAMHSGTHAFHFANGVAYKDILLTDRYKDLHWAVAFVDHSPPESRRDTIEVLRNRADFIVVHDAEPQAVVYQWGNLFETFKHRFYWDFLGNGTIILSDFYNIEME
jgi:hypothetical protein